MLPNQVYAANCRLHIYLGSAAWSLLALAVLVPDKSAGVGS
jgi:hypothetical protein